MNTGTNPFVFFTTRSRCSAIFGYQLPEVRFEAFVRTLLISAH